MSVRLLRFGLRRAARVDSRVGQMWICAETDDVILIVGEPTLASRLTAVSLVDSVTRGGWCHEVINLNRGGRYQVNEVSFDDNQSKVTTRFTRIV